ncbi:DUF2922 domain-containing protein [Marinilactibacillus sp. XAAS-LB27]|uniref:DUF2922 domain-containing protein n=1 Tax=Marinilactibacillus sp. XAAS-LB27 TaxID=3114538 RepID=UPI002E180844|nr:DUF2922 domain-containing protein [Marinilactibacillus sp. XAAS-LB27]
MATKLELRFETGEGKNKTIGINKPALNLDVETVESAMETIVSQELFEKDGIKLFGSIKGARYVTRTVDDLFEIK